MLLKIHIESRIVGGKGREGKKEKERTKCDRKR